ncbi:thioredoxin family protein [Spongiimicrobium salis]|uniref:thioredoxin family protein n=1 Tax=Spongiimicrobium salis TaxID=1667022 RepID=UPI00374DF52F
MMKNSLLIVMILFFSMSSFGQKKEKVTVYYFTATWCGPCKIFKKARKTEAMKEALSNVRLKKIDMDNDRRRLKEIYKVKSVPTFLKIGNKGKVLARIGGVTLYNIKQGDSILDYDYMAKVMYDFVNTDIYDY